MATDVVATAAGEIPQGMALNPWLDWAPLAGIPIWVGITIVFIIFFIGVNVYWLMRIGKLASVKGWAESLKNMTQEDAQVWVISRIQKLTIECMTIKDNVLSSHDKTNIAMWHHNSPMAAILVGGHKALVASEDFDHTRDIVSENALCYASDTFNENISTLKKTLVEKKEKGLIKDIPRVVDPILSYSDYEGHGRACLTALYPEGIKIPTFMQFNPGKFHKYFPHGCSAMFFGGELIHDARKLNLRRKAKSFWEVHALLAAAVVVDIFALIVVWLFPMGAPVA